MNIDNRGTLHRICSTGEMGFKRFCQANYDRSMGI